MTKQIKQAQLTTFQLEYIRNEAAQGTRESVLRNTLGLLPADWKKLKAQENSPLAQALTDGLDLGASEIIKQFRYKADEGDLKALEWLAKNVYNFRDNAPLTTDDTGPRIQIILNAPLSHEEYNAKVIDVKHN